MYLCEYFFLRLIFLLETPATAVLNSCQLEDFQHNYTVYLKNFPILRRRWPAFSLAAVLHPLFSAAPHHAVLLPAFDACHHAP